MPAAVPLPSGGHPASADERSRVKKGMAPRRSRHPLVVGTGAGPMMGAGGDGSREPGRRDTGRASGPMHEGAWLP